MRDRAVYRAIEISDARPNRRVTRLVGSDGCPTGAKSRVPARAGPGRSKSMSLYANPTPKTFGYRGRPRWSA